MDISKLEELLKSFYQISGMEVVLVDNNFHTILSATHNYNHFCSEIHRYPGCTEICGKSDHFHFNLLKSRQSLLKYTCPFGLFTILTPINKDGETVAALVMAPVIEEKSDSDNTPLSVTDSLIPGVNIKKIKQLVKRIPHYSREKLDAFSEMLLLLADTIERENLLEISKRNLCVWLL